MTIIGMFILGIINTGVLILIFAGIIHVSDASLHSSMIGQLSEYELNKIANYWIERMKALREEAYDEGAAEATMVCNEKTVPMAIEEKHAVDALYGYDAGRFAALQEVISKILKLKDCQYATAYDEAIDVLVQQLKDKK